MTDVIRVEGLQKIGESVMTSAKRVGGLQKIREDFGKTCRGLVCRIAGSFRDPRPKREIKNRENLNTNFLEIFYPVRFVR